VAQAAGLREEGAADVTREFEEIGLSAKAGWYAGAVMYVVGGGAVLLLGLLYPHTFHTGMTIASAAAVIMGFLCVFAARHLADANWAVHVRLMLGLAIVYSGTAMAGPPRVALMLLPMFILITPSYLYGPRFAVPYTAIAVALSFALMVTTEGAAPFAQAWISSTTIIAIVQAFVVAERRTRSFARANRRLAYTDALTGIANTRRLRERMFELLDNSHASGEAIGLFALDLDNFKLVNDRFDHGTGDRVLVAVATALGAELEPNDLVARRGGDEFSVLVPNAGERDLDGLRERLAEAIRRARMEVCPEITPSGGVAYVVSRADDTSGSLLQRADDQLHLVKQEFHRNNDEALTVERSADDAERSLKVMDQPQKQSRGRGSAALRVVHGPMRLWRWIVKTCKGPNPLWPFAAFSIGPIGIQIAVLSMAGALRPLSPVAGAVTGGAMLAIAVACIFAGKRDTPVQWIHLAMVPAFAIVGAATALASDSGAAMIDFLPLLVIFAFFFFDTRGAAVYLALGIAMFGAFAIGGSFPQGGARTAITSLVVLVGIGLTIKVRTITLKFAAKHRELSEVDALTGVYNVRVLRSHVQKAVEEARSGKPKPMLVAIDLDQFKHVNDGYSHTVGDEVLVAVARAITESVRMDDLVVRRGGDEFYVLSAGQASDLDGLLDRLGNSIGSARERICPNLLSSASIAIVEWHDGEDAEGFLNSADTALHDVKVERRATDYRPAIA
jgi:diguanylate cyclase (GGDEF)-like protein